MPRPHVHPSLTCYKLHGCRCKHCRWLNTNSKRHERQPKQARIPLNAEVLARLRRSVGL